MSQASQKILAVHPPIPQKSLGKYQNVKGVFVIRMADTVVYIGNSTNICKAALRLFQKGGALAAFNVHRATFEVIISTLRRPSVQTVLKKEYKPLHNIYRGKQKGNTSYEQRQAERIREAYLKQSRFVHIGEQKTDNT